MKWIYKRKFTRNLSRLFSIHFLTVNRTLFSLSQFMKKYSLCYWLFLLVSFLLLPSLFFLFFELLIDGRNTIQICWLTNCVYFCSSWVSSLKSIGNSITHTKKFVYSQFSQAWTKKLFIGRNFFLAPIFLWWKAWKIHF